MTDLVNISHERAIIAPSGKLYKLGTGLAAVSSKGKELSIENVVVDGDTVNIRFTGYFPIRFLGIDTPETKLKLGNDWPLLNDDVFEGYLEQIDPSTFLTDDGLIAHLQTKLKREALVNHYGYAKLSEQHLEDQITARHAALNAFLSDKGEDTEDMPKFFVAMAHEVFDGFARLLAFVNVDLPKELREVTSFPDLNTDLLVAGLAAPYFIFPNIDPFMKHSSGLDVVPSPSEFEGYLSSSGKLRHARRSIADARKNSMGIFNEDNPLMLTASELRILSRREPPSRYCIDIENPGHGILAPQEYYKIANLEDRLQIWEQHVPLFLSKGWQLSNDAAILWQSKLKKPVTS